MSILIKGMSKPKTCDDCIVPLSKCDCLQKRADDCPIIEIDLVRCGECKWCDDKGKGRALICTNPYIDMDIHPLDFCSYGERRADYTVFTVNPPKGVETPLKGDATVFHKNSKGE